MSETESTNASRFRQFARLGDKSYKLSSAVSVDRQNKDIETSRDGFVLRYSGRDPLKVDLVVYEPATESNNTKGTTQTVKSFSSASGRRSDNTPTITYHNQTYSLVDNHIGLPEEGFSNVEQGELHLVLLGEEGNTGYRGKDVHAIWSPVHNGLSGGNFTNIDDAHSDGSIYLTDNSAPAPPPTTRPNRDNLAED